MMISTICTSEAITRMKLTVWRKTRLKGTSTYFCSRKVTSVAMAITKVTAAVMPTAVLTFFDTPRNGHTPRNWLRTTLLTNIAEMKISRIFIVYALLVIFLKTTMR